NDGGLVSVDIRVPGTFVRVLDTFKSRQKSVVSYLVRYPDICRPACENARAAADLNPSDLQGRPVELDSRRPEEIWIGKLFGSVLDFRASIVPKRECIRLRVCISGLPEEGNIHTQAEGQGKIVP